MAKADGGAVQYYKDVAFHAVDLTETEEISLFEERERIKDDLSMKGRLKEIDDRLVLSVIKLGSEIAMRFAANIPGIDVKDAVQEANEALIDSIRLYNPNIKSKEGVRVKFNTYAHHRTVFKIKEFIMNNSRLVRLPRGKLDDLFRLIDAVESLGPDGTIEDLMVKVNEQGAGMNMEEVYKSLELLQGIHTSLDQTVRNDSVGKDQTLKDIIPVPDEVPNQEEILMKKDGVKRLHKEIMETLKPYKDLTYDVIFYRFLDPTLNKIRTYEETAKAMHLNNITSKALSREWVRQLEEKALERIRERCPELAELL